MSVKDRHPSHVWDECDEEDSPGHFMCRECYLCTCCCRVAEDPCQGEPILWGLEDLE